MTAERKKAYNKTRAKRLYATDPVYREKVKAYTKQWRKKNWIKVRAKRLGVSIEAAAEAFVRADGKCEACGDPRSLRLDHCHSVGRVRGILCHNCNVALGLLEDSIVRLGLLVSYLRERA